MGDSCDIDPKRLQNLKNQEKLNEDSKNVTLKPPEESYPMSPEAPSQIEKLQLISTPDADPSINLGNITFTFKQNDKDEAELEDDEDENLSTAPSPRPTWEKEFPKGNILQKKLSYEKQKGVKEITKTPRNTRKRTASTPKPEKNDPPTKEDPIMTML